jgi:hypothetical protein
MKRTLFTLARIAGAVIESAVDARAATEARRKAQPTAEPGVDLSTQAADLEDPDLDVSVDTPGPPVNSSDELIETWMLDVAMKPLLPSAPSLGIPSENKTGNPMKGQKLGDFSGTPDPSTPGWH